MHINPITEVRRNRSQKLHSKAEVTQFLKDGARAQNAPRYMSHPPHSTASIWKDAKSSYIAPFLHILEWIKDTHLSAKTQILVFSTLLLIQISSATSSETFPGNPKTAYNIPFCYFHENIRHCLK